MRRFGFLLPSQFCESGFCRATHSSPKSLCRAQSSAENRGAPPKPRKAGGLGRGRAQVRGRRRRSRTSCTAAGGARQATAAEGESAAPRKAQRRPALRPSNATPQPRAPKNGTGIHKTPVHACSQQQPSRGPNGGHDPCPAAGAGRAPQGGAGDRVVFAQGKEGGATPTTAWASLAHSLGRGRSRAQKAAFGLVSSLWAVREGLGAQRRLPAAPGPLPGRGKQRCGPHHVGGVGTAPLQRVSLTGRDSPQGQHPSASPVYTRRSGERP